LVFEFAIECLLPLLHEKDHANRCDAAGRATHCNLPLTLVLRLPITDIWPNVNGLIIRGYLLPIFDSILMWLRSHENILGWAVLFSLIMVVVTLLVIPIIFVRLPSRYLTEEDDRLPEIPGCWRWPYLAVKNFIGAVLVLAGLAMMILPGQGLLTLAVGLGLTNFPGKRRLIRRLIGQHRVLGAINRLRARAHKEPLEVPAGDRGEWQQNTP
jgi:hypothetical protein